MNGVDFASSEFPDGTGESRREGTVISAVVYRTHGFLPVPGPVSGKTKPQSCNYPLEVPGFQQQKKRVNVRSCHVEADYQFHRGHYCQLRETGLS